MSDILDELLEITAPHRVVAVSVEQTAELVRLCERAATEIRHLRSLAGAVTSGPSAADIYAPRRTFRAIILHTLKT